MPAQRRRYTRQQKVDAIVAAETTNATAAAEQTGIPESSIRYWLDNPKFAELRAKTQQERADGFRVASTLALARLIDLIPTMDAKDLIVFMGVATDKMQLLSGQATDRTETRDLTYGFDDHEREVLNDAIRGELARRSDERSAVPAVGTTGEAGAEGTPR